MAKYVSFLFVFILFIGCKGNEEIEKEEIEIETVVENKHEPQVKNENAVPVSPGDHVEYHPNGEVKITGKYDKNGERTGLWTSYYDNSVKWSESYYVNGKKDGHSFTFYPNGKVRYRGEYRNDEKVGTWTFYDEQGNVTKEENY